MPMRNLTVIILAAAAALLCYQKSVHSRFASTLADTLQIISGSYVREVNSRELFEGAMDGMVGSLDQYSDYITPAEIEEFREGLDQEFGGIGIIVEMHPETRRMTVMSPLVGTPAWEKGLRAGDAILAVDGEPTEEMDLRDAVKKMRGPKGTEVTLTLLHPGEQKTQDVTLRRAIINVESVMGDTRLPDGSWRFLLEEEPRFAYIRVTTFGQHTADEFAAAISDASQPYDGLILDLRGNAGGLLTAAVDMCDRFLDSGVIVTTRGRGGVVREEFTARPGTTLVPKHVPVVVLINRYSASASEIVAACLQDHGRAVVIGGRSWGKGTVQNVIPLEGGRSLLKLTTASYWRPSGADIHRHKGATEADAWGVHPNEGFEEVLTDAQYEAVLINRRRRDVLYREGEKPPASQSANGEESQGNPEGETAPPEAEDAPAVEPEVGAESAVEGAAQAPAADGRDLPLERAIEYLREQWKLQETPRAA